MLIFRQNKIPNILKLTDNKFLRLLDSLTPEEIIEFRKFVNSPFFTSGRNYSAIVKEILRLKSSKSSGISLSELHKKLYPNKKFSQQTLKNRFSELYKIGEDYLLFKSLGSNGIVREKIILEALFSRNLDKFFESNYKKTMQNFGSMPDDEKKFSMLIEIQRIHTEVLLKHGKYDAFFTEYYRNSIYMTCLSFINLFEFGIEFRQQDYLNKKYDFNMVPEILKKINFDELTKDSAYRNSPIIRMTLLYHHLYKCFENLDNENDYFEARKIFAEMKDTFSDEMKVRVYMMFIYYCTHKQNLGLKKFRLELFKLYNEKLESGFISDFKVNTYPLNNFRDYVLIGIELNELKWVEEFLEKYSMHLPDITREDEVNISRAKIAMATGNFKESMEYLDKTKPANFMHYLDVANLKLCNFYELGKTEESYSEIDKARHYIRNHKEVPRMHKLYFTNFVKIYSLLLKAKTDPSFKDLEYIGNELRSATYTNRGRWLQKKLDDLSHSRRSHSRK